MTLPPFLFCLWREMSVVESFWLLLLLSILFYISTGAICEPDWKQQTERQFVCKMQYSWQVVDIQCQWKIYLYFWWRQNMKQYHLMCQVRWCPVQKPTRDPPVRWFCLSTWCWKCRTPVPDHDYMSHVEHKQEQYKEWKWNRWWWCWQLEEDGHYTRPMATTSTKGFVPRVPRQEENQRIKWNLWWRKEYQITGQGNLLEKNNMIESK
jgi:hypothetical protein